MSSSKRRNAQRHPLMQIWLRDRGICWWCGNECRLENGTRDHVVPLDDGGSNGLDNLRLAHQLCNAKRDLMWHNAMSAHNMLQSDWGRWLLDRDGAWTWYNREFKPRYRVEVHQGLATVTQHVAEAYGDMYLHLPLELLRDLGDWASEMIRLSEETEDEELPGDETSLFPPHHGLAASQGPPGGAGQEVD